MKGEMLTMIDKKLLKKIDGLNMNNNNAPNHMVIVITNKCPNLCQMCCNNTSPHGAELDVNYFINWFEKNNVETDINHIWITGGEPLTHKQIIPLLEFLEDKRLKLNVGLGTSGCSKEYPELHETYYNNLKEIAERGLVDGITLTWAPSQGRNSWERIEEFLAFYKKLSEKDFEGFSYFDPAFELKKHLTLFDSDDAIEEFKRYLSGFYTKEDVKERIGCEFADAVEDWEYKRELEEIEDYNLENLMKYWSGRTGNVPEDEGICEYTVVIDYKNVPFSFFFASVDRPKEIAIRHDGSAEICCSVKAATPYKHPPTVGNIYKDPWDTLRDRFAKMHTLLENYAKELNKRGLKHTCYRCAWDDNNSFKNYLEKLKF